MNSRLKLSTWMELNHMEHHYMNEIDLTWMKLGHMDVFLQYG